VAQICRAGPCRFEPAFEPSGLESEIIALRVYKIRIKTYFQLRVGSDRAYRNLAESLNLNSLNDVISVSLYQVGNVPTLINLGSNHCSLSSQALVQIKQIDRVTVRFESDGNLC
jgi:hypothetical protein